MLIEHKNIPDSWVKIIYIILKYLTHWLPNIFLTHHCTPILFLKWCNYVLLNIIKYCVRHDMTGRWMLPVIFIAIVLCWVPRDLVSIWEQRLFYYYQVWKRINLFHFTCVVIWVLQIHWCFHIFSYLLVIHHHDFCEWDIDWTRPDTG